jgi:hypothetical protein
MSNRKCIFTGKKSDYKLNIAREDHHNWAKSIPTTKAYIEAFLQDRWLNELEMRQVELFFQMELCKIKQLSLMDRMERLRGQIIGSMGGFDTVQKMRFYKPDIKFSEEMERDMEEKVQHFQEKLENPDLVIIDDPGVPLPPEVFEPMELPKEAVVLTTPKKDDKIKKKVVKKKPALWD